MLYQRCLDLGRLDAEPSQLDLPVGPSHVVQAAVGPAAAEITGPVHAVAGRAVRVGDEALRAERGPAEIAAGHAGPGDVYLPGHPGGRRVQRIVQHVDAKIRQRNADWAARRRVTGLGGTGPDAQATPAGTQRSLLRAGIRHARRSAAS
jgi:hypothetical protein